MNQYIRAGICVPAGMIKIMLNRIIHGRRFMASMVCAVSPFTEFTIDKSARVRLGKRFRMRGGARIRVRRNGTLSIGNNVSINHNCMVVCHDNITIEDDVQFGPGVLIYDHDHDYKVKGGLKKQLFRTSPVRIGEGSWIGAGTVILRGTVIGSHSVIAAGSVVKGRIPSGYILYQKRESHIAPIKRIP